MALSVTSVTSAVLKGLDAFEVPVNPDDLFGPVRALRAIRLTVFADFIALVAAHTPIGYTDLRTRLEGSPIRTERGETFSNSGYYHLLAAAKCSALCAKRVDGRSTR